MDRLNSEGIPLSQLLITLRDSSKVMTARKFNSCFLCKRIGVNAAGLCDVCYGLLNGEELKMATRWFTGEGP